MDGLETFAWNEIEFNCAWKRNIVENNINELTGRTIASDRPIEGSFSYTLSTLQQSTKPAIFYRDKTHRKKSWKRPGDLVIFNR